jgi:hypothetical protein
MNESTRVRALCCECGNLRTVAANYRPPRDANNTDEADIHQRGWRCTATLKCAICTTKTRHALLRDDDEPQFRDYAELQQHERHALIRQQAQRRSYSQNELQALRRLRNIVAAIDPVTFALEADYGDLRGLLKQMMDSPEEFL